MTMSSTLTAPLADAADASSDDPRFEIRAGYVVIAAFVSVLCAWTALTPLDAAAVAQGQIAVSGHNQVVQHREGGVVSAVFVTEGQRVRAGQTLVQLAPEDVGAQAQGLRSQVISLQAQKARLLAEVENRPAIVWPAGFLTAAPEEQPIIQEAEAVQQAQFHNGRNALRMQQAVSYRRADGLTEQITGGQGQLAANVQQQALLDQQLGGVRSLAAKGYASTNSVRALERSASELQGGHDQLVANIADYQQQVAEAHLQASTLGRQRGEAAAASLRETQDQLDQLTPRLEAARQQLARGTLRSQVDGVVTGLNVFSPGSVVAPGQKLLEVVPSHPSLVVDARLSSRDIEGVRPGQVGEVRFSSLSARRVPLLKGLITRVSADSFVEERTGQTYYTVEVTVPERELRLVGDDATSAVRPGVPVQVMIAMRKRNAFEYLFEPISQSLWSSFRQR